MLFKIYIYISVCVCAVKVIFRICDISPMTVTLYIYIYYQRKFGRNFRVTDSREEMRLESEVNEM